MTACKNGHIMTVLMLISFSMVVMIFLDWSGVNMKKNIGIVDFSDSKKWVYTEEKKQEENPIYAYNFTDFLLVQNFDEMDSHFDHSSVDTNSKSKPKPDNSIGL